MPMPFAPAPCLSSFNLSLRPDSISPASLLDRSPQKSPKKSYLDRLFLVCLEIRPHDHTILSMRSAALLLMTQNCLVSSQFLMTTHTHAAHGACPISILCHDIDIASLLVNAGLNNRILKNHYSTPPYRRGHSARASPIQSVFRDTPITVCYTPHCIAFRD